MPRPFNVSHFHKVYDDYIVKGCFNEERHYYEIYKYRYQALIGIYARLSSEKKYDVLDVGGGQLGLLTKILWDDNVTVIDLDLPYLDYLRKNGVKTQVHNLYKEEKFFVNAFDTIFISEVIEHIPVPAHIIFKRLNAALRPGGVMICTTPNLYGMRNLLYIIAGKRLYANFTVPTDTALGHVILYDRDHLKWQLEQAGFTDNHISNREFFYNPENIIKRAAYWATCLFYIIPRFRNSLLAVAKK